MPLLVEIEKTIAEKIGETSANEFLAEVWILYVRLSDVGNPNADISQHQISNANVLSIRLSIARARAEKQLVPIAYSSLIMKEGRVTGLRTGILTTHDLSPILEKKTLSCQAALQAGFHQKMTA